MCTQEKDDCEICHGTGSQKLQGTTSVTIRPCPKNCKSPDFGDSSDAENSENCPFCGNTGNNCSCKFSQKTYQNL